MELEVYKDEYGTVYLLVPGSQPMEMWDKLGTTTLPLTTVPSESGT